ncbi:MAG: 50S ribosomal protein L11 methyltransferase [Pseudomonadota bacterium]
MSWLQFSMPLAGHDAEIVEALLLESGAQSVTLSDAADEPVLEPGVGETPLWSQTRITALFEADLDSQQLLGFLRSELGSVDDVTVEVLEDRDWEREWLRDFRPMPFGERLWVCPGDADASEADAVVVRLDPGLAFGTGTHPTTAMCLEWLDGQVLDGCSVLDYGCGSGVLAIAALKLGAASAAGTDIDPQALIATRQNAERNGVTVELVTTPDQLGGPFDVVVANILAGPLVELANQLSEYVKTSGRLALSGILEEQAASVRKAYEPWVSLDEQVVAHQDGQNWVRLSGHRQS